VKRIQANRQIEELKEVVKAAGSQLVFFPKIVLAVELQLKQTARNAKVSSARINPL
jgi:hypothetical protein